VDITDHQLTRNLMNEVVQTYGALNCLVNCADITGDIESQKLTPDDRDTIHGVSLRGLFFAMQAATPHLGAGGSAGQVARATAGGDRRDDGSRAPRERG
jgi:3-oxoacyl-[acyl-carrier protein] reductase